MTFVVCAKPDPNDPNDPKAHTQLTFHRPWCRTCLDQGSVVVFDEKFDPEKPGYQKLPTLDMSNIMV